jgi:hypothetical protein
MKRFLLCLILTLVSTAALAQVGERDVLVTPEGTIYSATTEYPEATSPTDPTSVIGLSVQSGAETHHLTVPASISAGFHSGAALAYDSDSKTLFVLWIHMPNQMSSEFLLASYRDGKWQPAVLIDHQAYTVRSNLRLGITRRVSQLQKDGSYVDVPALLLHALWWDDSLKGEEARYALLPIENGALLQDSVDIHSLEEFVGSGDEAYTAVDPKFNAAILRQPAVVSTPMQSSIDVVFGDTKKNSIHSVTLQPIADIHIHIPVGIGGGKPGNGPRSLSAPASFTADWQGPISVLARGDRLVFANATDKALNYITYTDGAWTGVKSIPIDSKFPAEAALAALDKMVSTQ